MGVAGIACLLSVITSFIQLWTFLTSQTYKNIFSNFSASNVRESRIHRAKLQRCTSSLFMRINFRQGAVRSDSYIVENKNRYRERNPNQCLFFSEQSLVWFALVLSGANLLSWYYTIQKMVCYKSPPNILI